MTAWAVLASPTVDDALIVVAVIVMAALFAFLTFTRVGKSMRAVADNPMLAATGHRICNDCMKSCIYQKQEPVNIPQAETRTLKDVLELPWGFEIYSLLTRWNPLDLRRPNPRERSGKRDGGQQSGEGETAHDRSVL